MIVKPVKQLKGELSVPGDKSISHRSIMFGALSEGTTTISNFLLGADCLSTIDCFRKLGIDIEINETNVTVKGKGLRGLSAPKEILDVGNSGTTLRLITGILAAQPFESQLTGDDSIQRRPMKRIMIPLSEMGASIESLLNNGCAPLKVIGKPLKGIRYTLPIASAQIKSSILLAALYAEGPTQIIEPSPSRNHSEIMLKYFGGHIEKEGNVITIYPKPNLTGQEVIVPGDISSAAYFITAGLIVPHSKILVKNVGVNPTRDGLIEVYKRMNGNLTLLNERTVNGEKIADIQVSTSELTGTTIEGDIIPRLIDEIPIIAVAAAFAKGKTIIKDASELKVKESNRIEAMVTSLRKMGVAIEETDDGMIIEGPTQKLKGQTLDSYHDHRIAMSLAIASLVAEGPTEILNSECIDISYPNFFSDLEQLM